MLWGFRARIPRFLFSSEVCFLLPIPRASGSWFRPRSLYVAVHLQSVCCSAAAEVVFCVVCVLFVPVGVDCVGRIVAKFVPRAAR